jgi:hypothetical protein
VRRGASNREIASELFLAPKTIEFHLRQIYRKLGVHSRAQLVAMLARRAEHDLWGGWLLTSPRGAGPSSDFFVARPRRRFSAARRKCHDLGVLRP